MDMNRAVAARGRGEEASEFRLGRLKHERIKIPRVDQVWIGEVRLHGNVKFLFDVAP